MRNITNFFDRFYLIFLYLLFTLMGYNPIVSKCLYLSMILVLCSLIVKAYKKRNICLFVAFLYMLPYTSVLYYSLWGTHVQLSYYTQFNTQRAFFDSAMIHFLFLVSFNFFLIIKQGPEKFTIHKENTLLFYISIFCCLYATIFGKTGDINFFSLGEYSPDYTRSSLFEYFFVFDLISLKKKKKTKKNMCILYSIAAFYIFKNTLFGGRIESLMCILLLLVVDLQKKLKFKIIILLLVVGYCFAFLLGIIRTYGFSWELIRESFFNNPAVIITQESDVNYSSVRIIEMVRLNVLTIEQRLQSFYLFCLSIFVPRENLPDLADLSLYKQATYPCGGGGLVSAFSYVFLGYIGVVLIGYFVAKIFSNGLSGHKSFKNIFFILTFTTMPRWFAYYPISLFKLALLGSVVVYLLIIIHEVLWKK